MNETRASVIIPAHNAASTLGHQLEALAAQNFRFGFEVLVVANRCTDATVDIANSFADRLNIRAIVANDLASAAYPRSVGAGAAVGDYLLFCDADDIVESGWIAGMVEPLDSLRADLVGGLIEVEREGLADWIYEWRYAAFDGRCLRTQAGELPYAISASLGVTSEAFHAVGGFDARFAGAGFEEVDLARRLLRSGFRLGEAPTAVVRYAPRTTVSAVLAQAQGYAQGWLVLADKEGVLGPCPPILSAVNTLARVVAHQVVRQRDLHPFRVYARTRERYNRILEHRRWDRTHGSQQGVEMHYDFFAPVSTPIIGGLAFEACTGGEAAWYATAGLEHKSLAVLARFLPQGGVFVDVGANIGVFSVAAARQVGEHGRVVAFEPSERTRDVLRTNLERHRAIPRVQLRPEAVGSSPEIRAFRTYANTLVAGFGEAPQPFNPGPLLDMTEVQVTTLSDAVEGPVDMIKIDVEGFEAEVLSGSKDLIGRSPDLVILFELNQAALAAANSSMAEVLGFLPSEGWEFWLIDEDGEELTDALVPFNAADAANRAIVDPGWYANVLATRRTGAPM